MSDPTPFQDYLVSVVRRLRLQKAISQAGWTLGILSLLLALVLLGKWAFQQWPLPLESGPLILIAIALSLLAGVLAYLAPLPPSVAAKSLDRLHKLPDSAISSYELGAESHDPDRSEAWKRAQVRDTLKRLHSAPLPRLRWQALGAGGAVFVFAVFISWLPPLSLHSSAPSQASSPTLPDAAKLDLLFEEWEKTASEGPDPELKALLEAIAPFRQELQQGEPTLQSVFIELSKIDDRLSSSQEALQASSLDAQAGKLADALRQAGGLDALAERLREQAYDKAAEAARQASLEIRENGEGSASANLSASVRQNLQSLSANMASSGNQPMSQALQQLAQSQSSDALSEALQQMSEALDQENSRQQSLRQTALQRMQLASAKEAMEKGETPEAGLSLVPQISQTKQEGQGLGAGAESNPDSAGAVTASSLQGAPALTLKGTADALGESTVSTIRAPDAPRLIAPTQEGLIPADYQRLSRQAVEDENLPLAHRLAIRRYFEMIRAATPTPETP